MIDGGLLKAARNGDRGRGAMRRVQEPMPLYTARLKPGPRLNASRSPWIPNSEGLGGQFRKGPRQGVARSGPALRAFKIPE